MTYKVRYYQDGNYEVYSIDDDCEFEESHFIGSIAECESYIRLKNGGYL